MLESIKVSIVLVPYPHSVVGTVLRLEEGQDTGEEHGQRRSRVFSKSSGNLTAQKGCVWWGNILEVRSATSSSH